MADVDTTARTADALDSLECRGASRAVFERHEQRRETLGSERFLTHVGDVALDLEKIEDVALDLARWHPRHVMPRHGGIPNAGEHVRDGVRIHGFTSSPWSLLEARL